MPDVVLPYTEVAERIAIGTLLLSNSVYHTMQDLIRDDDFYLKKWRVAFQEFGRMYREKGKVELGDLGDHLREFGVSMFELSQAMDDAQAYQSTDWAARKIRDYADRRRVVELGYRLQQEAPLIEDIGVLHAAMVDLATHGQRERGHVYSGTECCNRILERQAGRRESTDTIEGFRTGFSTVDSHLGGLKPPRTTLLIGPQGHGKTGMALNWIANACIFDGVPTLFASLEMDTADVEDRLVGIVSGVELKVIKTGYSNFGVQDATAGIEKAPLYLSDNRPREVYDVCSMIERYAITKGIRLFILDYMAELVRDKVQFKEDRDERFARWLKLIRDACKRHDIHSVILAQVNAEEQIAESKKLGHQADAILFFKRDSSDHVLECRKNRFGPVGYKYAIDYNRETQRMKEVGIIREDGNE